MEVRFNVIKEARKALVAAVSEITNVKADYQGAPSFAFKINGHVVDKNGTMSFDEQTDVADIRTLLTALTERGFVFEGDIDEIVPAAAVSGEANGENERTPRNDAHFAEASISETSDRLVLEVPLAGFSHTALDNLEKLVEGKAALIMKAIGADSLPIERTESTLRFPWFPFPVSHDATDAYTRFVCALCELAKKQKRVTMKEAQIDADSSEKFAFRCFLLRLGFKGDEYKNARRVLLSKLSGNGSFKTGDHKRGSAPESITSADSGEDNAEATSVREHENNADSAVTSGGDAAYAYDPDLTDYDALMARGGN